jgi:hypothetical protein
MQESSFVHDDHGQRDLSYNFLNFNLRKRLQDAVFEIAVWSPLHGNTYLRVNLKPREKLNKRSPELFIR